MCQLMVNDKLKGRADTPRRGRVPPGVASGENPSQESVCQTLSTERDGDLQWQIWSPYLIPVCLKTVRSFTVSWTAEDFLSNKSSSVASQIGV